MRSFFFPAAKTLRRALPGPSIDSSAWRRLDSTIGSGIEPNSTLGVNSGRAWNVIFRNGPPNSVRIGCWIYLCLASETALTRDVEIAATESGLPNTFVPGRNIIFLTFAAAVAYRRGLKHVVTGVCETDFSGYPDCRDDTVKALQVALNLGMESRFVLETPLIWIDKAQTWTLAEELGGTALVNLIRTSTLTCYHGEVGNIHEWGRGCGVCPACELRAKGYRQFVKRTATLPLT